METHTHTQSRRARGSKIGGKSAGGWFGNRRNDEAVVDDDELGGPAHAHPSNADVTAALADLQRTVSGITESAPWTSANRRKRVRLERALAATLNSQLLFAIAPHARITAQGVGKCTACGRFASIGDVAHGAKCPALLIERGTAGCDRATACRLAQAGFRTVGEVRVWAHAIDRLGIELAGLAARAGWAGPTEAVQWAETALATSDDPTADLKDNPMLLDRARADVHRVVETADRLSLGAVFTGADAADAFDTAWKTASNVARRAGVADPEAVAGEVVASVTRFVRGKGLMVAPGATREEALRMLTTRIAKNQVINERRRASWVSRGGAVATLSLSQPAGRGDGTAELHEVTEMRPLRESDRMIVTDHGRQLSEALDDTMQIGGHVDRRRDVAATRGQILVDEITARGIELPTLGSCSARTAHTWRRFVRENNFSLAAAIEHAQRAPMMRSQLREAFPDVTASQLAGLRRVEAALVDVEDREAFTDALIARLVAQPLAVA